MFLSAMAHKKNIKKEIFTKPTVLLDIARPFDTCSGLFEFFFVFLSNFELKENENLLITPHGMH